MENLTLAEFTMALQKQAGTQLQLVGKIKIGAASRINFTHPLAFQGGYDYTLDELKAYETNLERVAQGFAALLKREEGVRLKLTRPVFLEALESSSNIVMRMEGLLDADVFSSTNEGYDILKSLCEKTKVQMRVSLNR